MSASSTRRAALGSVKWDPGIFHPGRRVHIFRSGVSRRLSKWSNSAYWLRGSRATVDPGICAIKSMPVIVQPAIQQPRFLRAQMASRDHGLVTLTEMRVSACSLLEDQFAEHNHDRIVVQ